MRTVENAGEGLNEQLRRALSPSAAERARVRAAIEDLAWRVRALPRQAAIGRRSRVRSALANRVGLSLAAAFLVGAGASIYWKAVHTPRPHASRSPAVERRLHAHGAPAVPPMRGFVSPEPSAQAGRSAGMEAVQPLLREQPLQTVPR